MAKIGMFGAGYVGLVTGACFAELGHDVVIRDVVPDRIERLLAGEVPIYEEGLDQVLERNRDRIRFTSIGGRSAATSSTWRSGRRRRSRATPISLRCGR